MDDDLMKTPDGGKGPRPLTKAAVAKLAQEQVEYADKAASYWGAVSRELHELNASTRARRAAQGDLA